MDNNKQLWEKILAEVELEVSRANFLTLFKRTQLVSVEEKVLTVAVPSTMIIDLLQRRFYDVIKKSTDKHIGNDSKIIFVPRTIIDVVNTKSDPKGTLFDFQKTDFQKPTPHTNPPRVRAEYTFENIAVSSSNQLAFVSASTVAKKPGEAYNPLFIYGPTGVGKTHLMQAIANELYAKNPNRKIIYITSEEFTNEVVEAIRTNNTAGMKRRFRDIDLLIIDDIQFIAGKERVQEELFHTFNALVDKSSQIVLSSDRKPEDIKQVEKRLISRFSGGLTVDVGEPDFELKTAILLIKAKKYDCVLTIDAAKIIAQNATDIRSLEGLLLRVITQAQSTNEEITDEFVSSVLALNKNEKLNSFHPDEIIKNVCSYYNVKPTQLKSAKRDAFLVRPRQIAMFLLKKELGLTFVEIGNLLGGRDHTTIMHGVDKVDKMLEKSLLKEDIFKINNISTGKNVD